MSKSERIEMIGQLFGRLRVEAYSHTEEKRAMWRCRCECGTVGVWSGKPLRSGNTRSCGCLQRDRASEANHIHGMGDSRAYRAWFNAVKRCTRRSHRQYRHYGGRGITVCERWLTFENFLADMGEPGAGLTLDRIDNERGYEPGNCRWTDYQTQLLNRRNTVRLDTPHGIMTVPEASKRTGLSPSCLWYRAKAGFSRDRILSPNNGNAR